MYWQDRLLSYLTIFCLFAFWFFAFTCVQWCPTLGDPMACSPLGFSVHGILQERILKWVAIPSSRGSSWSRNRTHVSCTSFFGKQVLYPCTTREALLSQVSNSKFTSSYKISAASFGIKYFIWWDKMQEIDSLRCQILDPWRLPWSLDQGPGLITQELLCSRVLLKWKRGRESFWHGHQKGMESAPLASLRKGSYILFQLVITITNVSRM